MWCRLHLDRLSTAIVEPFGFHLCIQGPANSRVGQNEKSLLNRPFGDKYNYPKQQLKQYEKQNECSGTNEGRAHTRSGS